MTYCGTQSGLDSCQKGGGLQPPPGSRAGCWEPGRRAGSKTGHSRERSVPQDGLTPPSSVVAEPEEQDQPVEQEAWQNGGIPMWDCCMKVENGSNFFAQAVRFCALWK